MSDVEMNEAARQEHKPSLKARLRNRISNYANERRIAHEEKREQKSREEYEGKKAYEEGRRKGFTKGQYRRGYAEGKARAQGRGHGGTLGTLKQFGGFIASHPMDVDVVGKEFGYNARKQNTTVDDIMGTGGKGSNFSGFGGSSLESALGFGSPKKGKRKRSREDEFGF